MNTTLDLNAYFKRIGFTGNAKPDLATLQNIIVKHTEAIPFENLDPLLQRPVPLDESSLEQKMIHNRRGGYCFEQNLLLRSVLVQLGYKVTGLEARVQWQLPGDMIIPRAHMLLLIELDSIPHLADVGFGGLTLTGVLRLETDTVQQTPHERYKLVNLGSEYLIQVYVQEEWRPLHLFDLQEQHPVDYEAPNWFVSTHPMSPFRQVLMTARALKDRRYSLFNNRFTIYHKSGEVESRTLATAAELRDVLQNEFAIPLSDIEGIDEVLKKLIG